MEKQGRRIVAAKADIVAANAGIQGIAATAAETLATRVRPHVGRDHPGIDQRVGIDTSAYEPPNSRKVVTP